jgi:hypothetical protein
MRVIDFKGSMGLILVSKEEVQFFGAYLHFDFWSIYFWGMSYILKKFKKKCE